LFRLYGTFAAPLFILISGMMVGLTTSAKGYGLKHFSGTGNDHPGSRALIDVFLWRI